MTRIIAGSAGGRRISAPRGDGTRPTSDRVREALFASVTAELGTLSGTRVLDLYAGSGALGLEALSRGAAHALLIESDRRAASVIRDNVAALGFTGAQVAQQRVEPVLARRPPHPYNLLFADPPYAVPEGEVHTALALATEWLVAGALVVVERSARDAPLTWPPGFHSLRVRRYGDTALWYGRAAE